MTDRVVVEGQGLTVTEQTGEDPKRRRPPTYVPPADQPETRSIAEIADKPNPYWSAEENEAADRARGLPKLYRGGEIMTEHGKYQELIDASEWALKFMAHRDEMNAAVHASTTVKWSEATRHMALGLTVAGVRSYQITAVMYSWFDTPPNHLEAEAYAAIQRLRSEI